MEFLQLIGEYLRKAQQDRKLKLALVDQIVYQFLYVNGSRIALRRADCKMAFSVYLKVSCSPILHTIGLNDLFQCDVLHLRAFPAGTHTHGLENQWACKLWNL